ncbi:MAG: hypothetical protein HQL12_04200 [Candidatus Omnitrophica bacterium]|nr:hypothetical protein [Candidatus Omnitrophota bacterium]
MAVRSYPYYTMTLEKKVAIAKTWGLFAFIIYLGGCQTAPHTSKAARTEEISALTTMTKGLTNQPINETKLKNLAARVAKDPQAQSAIRSINTALSAQHTVKYCPVDGQRFSADVDTCPIHHVKLEWVE